MKMFVGEKKQSKNLFAPPVHSIYCSTPPYQRTDLSMGYGGRFGTERLKNASVSINQSH